MQKVDVATFCAIATELGLERNDSSFFFTYPKGCYVQGLRGQGLVTTIPPSHFYLRNLFAFQENRKNEQEGYWYIERGWQNILPSMPLIFY
jgi:hypothetical protein